MHGIFGRVNIGDETIDKNYIKSIGNMYDKQSFFIDKNVGMCISRIICNENIQKDIPAQNEEGDIVAMLNGEIHNYQELEDDLVSKNHRFSDKSDTELITHLYEEYGGVFAEKINGLFTIALWDSKKKMFYLITDLFGGIYDIYYAARSDYLVFGSRINTVLQDPAIKKEINIEALNSYFTYSVILLPMTMFKGINKLSPGHILKYSNDGVFIKRYTDITFPKNKTMDESYAANKFLELMKDAVRIRMDPDSKAGVFLSGGLDSSTIVALASQMYDYPIETFTVGFEHPETELNDARVVADYYDTNHHEHIIDSSDITKNFREILSGFDEPFGGHGALVLYYSYNLLKKHGLNVVLSGDGSDNLFGYLTKHVRRRMRAEGHPLWPITKKGFQIIEKYFPRWISAFTSRTRFKILYADDPRIPFYFNPNFTKKHLYTQDIYKEIKKIRPTRIHIPDKDLEYVNNFFIKNFEINHFAKNILMVEDGMMGNVHSVITRTPFLDNNVVGFINSLSMDLKTRDHLKKYLLRRAMHDLLPEEIMQKRKQGRGLPYDLITANKEEITNVLSDIHSKDFLDERHVRSLLVKFHNRCAEDMDNIRMYKRIKNFIEGDIIFKAYNLYVFEMWYRKYFD